MSNTSNPDKTNVEILRQGNSIKLSENMQQKHERDQTSKIG
jgi:hypothetical protein